VDLRIIDAKTCSGCYSRRVAPNLQLADPELRGSVDTDEALALPTRRAFVARWRAAPAERVLSAEEVQ